MDIVYASLKHRRSGTATEHAEAAEAVDALWAHTEPGDGLQHVSAQPASDRVDFLLYFLSRDPSAEPGVTTRAHRLISRSHKASLLLRQAFLPPEPPAAPEPPEPAGR